MCTTSLTNNILTKDNIYEQNNTNNRKHNRYRNSNFINRILRTTDQRFIELKKWDVSPLLLYLTG